MQLISTPFHCTLSLYQAFRLGGDKEDTKPLQLPHQSHKDKSTVGGTAAPLIPFSVVISQVSLEVVRKKVINNNINGNDTNEPKSANKKENMKSGRVTTEKDKRKGVEKTTGGGAVSVCKVFQQQLLYSRRISPLLENKNNNKRPRDDNIDVNEDEEEQEDEENEEENEEITYETVEDHFVLVAKLKNGKEFTIAHLRPIHFEKDRSDIKSTITEKEEEDDDDDVMVAFTVVPLRLQMHTGVDNNVSGQGYNNNNININNNNISHHGSPSDVLALELRTCTGKSFKGYEVRAVVSGVQNTYFSEKQMAALQGRGK